MAQTSKAKYYKPKVSDSNLLGVNLSSATKFAHQFTSVHSQVDGEVDTLRLLAIRVDFPADDNTLTTGNGKFQLQPDPEKTIDRPPHNRAYFQAQLLALKNYYRKVSRGKLILEADVFPVGDTASYTVSNQMSYYAPAGNEQLLDTRLAELLQEGFQVADQADAIDFSQYDSYIIFHAGVGGDFALDFDATPQDIPSVFLNFESLQQELGAGDPGYTGIAVNGGAFHIREGMILPETQSQEEFEIGLLGTIALMFGNQLGLPILFNPDNGRSGIGVFGLMDQGSGNFLGLLPAEPCAWSKIFLGWETPIEMKNGEALPVAASFAANENKIYKIPINAKEYFLIENRQRDANGDSLAIGFDINGEKVIEFDWDAQSYRVVPDAGVITSVSEYDFGLPGSGILIWHIDENVIEANFAQNRVNADPNRRGVDLEEADGAQDIGQFYTLLSAGFGAENGLFQDMFWASNEINLELNRTESVIFSPETIPSTKSNTGANSYIRLFDFSEPDSVMSFSVTNTILRPGFPQLTSQPGTNANAPVAADLNNDGIAEIIATSNTSAEIYVWYSDGSKFIANDEDFQVTGINGVTESYPKALFASPDGNKIFSPAIRTSQSGTFVLVTTDREFIAYQPEDTNLNGRADQIFAYSPAANISTSPLLYSNTDNLFDVAFGTVEGEIVLVGNNEEVNVSPLGSGPISGLARTEDLNLAYTTSSGTLGLFQVSDEVSVVLKQTASGFQTPPVVADINQDGVFEIVAISTDGELFAVEQDNTDLPGFPKSTTVQDPSALAVSDIDGDGFLDIIFTGENHLYAFNQVGNLKDFFPVELSRSESVGLAAPILADLTSDGLPEIITGTANNQLVAYSGISGRQVEEFPVSAGGQINSTPYFTDIEGDGDTEIIAAADDGFIYVWDFANSYDADASPWPGLFAGFEHLNFNGETNELQQPTGSAVMPKNLVYNYPNPTEGSQTTIRYRLNETAKVKIKIYDLAGDFVDELVGTGYPQADNEVTWSLDNIQSGVYLARVEARGETKSDVAIIKIAVVK